MKKQLCFLFLTLGILRALADAQVLQNVNGLTTYGPAAGADLTNNNVNAFVIYTNNQVSLSVNSSGIFVLTNYAAAGLGISWNTNGSGTNTGNLQVGSLSVGSFGSITSSGLASSSGMVFDHGNNGVRFFLESASCFAQLGNISKFNQIGIVGSAVSGSPAAINLKLGASNNLLVDTGVVTPGLVIATNGFTSYTNSLGLNSFTFPATTVNWTNPVHIAIEVYIDNTAVTGTIFKKNGTQIFGGLSTDLTIGLRDGEYFSETYTIGTPSGTWSVFP